MSVLDGSQGLAGITLEDSSGRITIEYGSRTSLIGWLNQNMSRVRSATVRHLVVGVRRGTEPTWAVLEASLTLQSWLTEQQLDAQVYLIDLQSPGIR